MPQKACERSDSEMWKMGHFKKKNIRKLGISKKKHVINFKTEKEPKIKLFDFWAFKKR